MCEHYDNYFREEEKDFSVELLKQNRRMQEKRDISQGDLEKSWNEAIARIKENQAKPSKDKVAEVFKAAIQPSIPKDARDLEVFHIQGGEAFIGFKLANGNFHFIQVPYTPRKL